MTQSRTVNLNGTEAHYLETGEGDAVILLHGMPGDSRTWRYNVDVIAIDSRSLALDFPGWGQSHIAKGESYETKRLADYVHDFMEAVGLERAVFVGNGFGGLVALELALRRPDVVEGLVLSSVEVMESDSVLAIRTSSTRLGRLFKGRTKGSAKSLVERGYAYRENIPSVLVAGYANAAARTRTLAALQASQRAVSERLPRLREEVSRISARTLLVWGDKDSVCAQENAQALANALPRSSLVTLPHAGHYPHEESPAGFNNALRAFLKERQSSHGQAN